LPSGRKLIWRPKLDTAALAGVVAAYEHIIGALRGGSALQHQAERRIRSDRFDRFLIYRKGRRPILMGTRRMIGPRSLAVGGDLAASGLRPLSPEHPEEPRELAAQAEPVHTSLSSPIPKTRGWQIDIHGVRTLSLPGWHPARHDVPSSAPRLGWRHNYAHETAAILSSWTASVAAWATPEEIRPTRI
tara:strand:- start:11509 stop:12072 length:564 start_codon:yes stop_codon:yes gene_type:complete